MNTENPREIQNIHHLSHVGCTGQELRLTDCSHEDIGVHTCGSNSNENAAIECSVAKSIIIPSISISTAHSFPVVFPTAAHLHYTSISAQATSTFTTNNAIIFEQTNLSSNLEILTVSRVAVSTSYLPPLQRNVNIFASVLSTISLCVIGLILVALFIGIKKKCYKKKNKQNR